ncbi:bifunctional adenosylcobinamide kinase/adenosylcobinamide-phosphate guanylyltransferase [Bacillus sp. AGMB 02131]|uniref:Bifunctional adenosylcobinamide kinase/adenosylcobinamide-phosphate guanylyltransferase n=1 Tax=Peribacillus faecalis TaxID=2772559 RepID=A0A927CV37_9BACI|nr:bifunctional adenosylcobinamide kinase/adenosylcobinamide-phosphate guanylyltransferase [Peribacillus faecalis]MBD3107734.1 bifunctional adenosylcobinamide kinase/adenosylcobinamide-phosphate guanylyltransferase [Peribacillus faecalis]
MHVVIGGAYSGKRQFVRENWESFQLISAYEKKHWDESVTEAVIAYEGFEVWVEELLDNGKSNDEIINWFKQWLNDLDNRNVILIMLEIGKGIVPIEEKNRRLRDIVGWIQQEAVRQADKATSIWHGLAKTMK